MANQRLRQALSARQAQGRLLIAPGVYDMVSLRLASAAGFDALYMSGYATVASHLGLPDAGIATYTDMVGRVQLMAGSTEVPLIADADTGFGGLLNVEHCVRGYERAGAAAIQFEDQVFPKRCGHTPGRRVVPTECMAQKVRTAVCSRSTPDLLIVARTDARTALGLDEALRRGEAYARAGADLLFIEAPEHEEELARIGAAFRGGPWLVINMVERGRTPLLGARALAELGFTVAIYPVTGLLAAAAALERAYAALKRDGSSVSLHDELYRFEDMHTLLGFDEVWRRDRELDGRQDPSPVP